MAEQVSNPTSTGPPEPESDDSPVSSRGPSSDPVDAFWERVLARWEDDEIHAAFLEHARALGRLRDAAQHYRAHAEQASGDDQDEVRARVQERLATITAIAIGDLHRSREPEKPHRWGRTVMIILAIALFIAAIKLLLQATAW